LENLNFDKNHVERSKKYSFQKSLIETNDDYNLVLPKAIEIDESELEEKSSPKVKKTLISEITSRNQR